MISAIVAVDNNWGIGFNGNLLERIPEDLKRFKSLTKNHVIIMGRKTWDSLPNKPLKDRLNLVITSQERCIKDEMTAFISLEEAISRMTHIENDEEWFVIGGGTIYQKLLSYCNRVYVTKIYKNYDNVDTYFPNLDSEKDWLKAPVGLPTTHKDVTYQYWVYDKI